MEMMMTTKSARIPRTTSNPLLQEGSGRAVKLLNYLYYLYPILLFIFFLSAFISRSIAKPSNDNANKNGKLEVRFGPGGKPLPVRTPTGLRRKQAKEDFPRSRKLVFQWLSVLICSTFLANTFLVVVHALYDRERGWWCGEAPVVYIVGSFFVYSMILISLVDTQPSPTSSQFATWGFAILLETVLLATYLAVHSKAKQIDWWHGSEITIHLVRITILFGLLFFYFLFAIINKRMGTIGASVDESTSLLNASGRPNGTANGNGHLYGSTPPSRGGEEEIEEPGWVRPQKALPRGWWEYIKGYSVFFPYLWPSKDRRLQVVVVVCFLLVLAQRGINVLVPHQIGVITDDLSGELGDMTMPWIPICIYITYRMLQGSNGFLGAARAALWIPVSQYSYRELAVASFEHVHSLSLDFHLGKKTGEVLSALGKGGSINSFLEQVTFQVVPMVFDLAVAVGYFLIEFDVYYALVIIVMTFWYIYITIRLAQWRAEARRTMVNADREQDAVKNDSMVSYETVKYFNAEAYEFNRYREAVKTYQRAEYKVTLSLNIMNISQNFIFMLGFIVVCFIAAYQVTTGQIRVGKFVSLLTYMGQLQAPLNYFGTFYRVIQSSMINAERLLELFKEQPTVVDEAGAKELDSCQGDIRFTDVRFAYDQRKNALQGLYFHCKPGTTTAFVGESGGGKSTVFRLLFRFYNAQGGKIEIDGNDVQDVTIDSVRRHIGVVPQDTVLFNETLMYNLKYANPDASDEAVYAACRAASIHDKILSFPDGYDTKVGERGLRLSGGEKQRVAIARTILKGPRIIMLDEATAALDTETEQNIQEALTTLANGRTMLVIAHRLSTIARADQILVLHQGQVVEKGTHEELLTRRGRYATMWRKQIKAQKAADEAKMLNDKADRLRRESKVLSERPDLLASSSSTSEGEDDHKDPKGR